MGYNFKGKKATELWAVVDNVGAVLWSRGGSSTSPKLMVYDKKESAERALKNNWTQQIIGGSKVMIKKIYLVEPQKPNKD